MWPNSITGKKMSIRKRGRVTGVFFYLGIFMSQLREVSGPKSYGKATRFGSTSYVASVGTCHVIMRSTPIGYEHKPHAGGFWRPFVC